MNLAVAEVPTHGAEQELFGVDDIGRLIDMKEFDGAVLTDGSSVTQDAAWSSLEVNFKYGTADVASSQADDLIHLVRELGVPVLWGPRAPYSGPMDGESLRKLWRSNQRYDAIWAAAAHEMGEHGGNVGVFALYASCQVHWGLNTRSQEAVLLRNVMELLGPMIYHNTCNRYSIDGRGHSSIWSLGWVDVRRGPLWGRWHESRAAADQQAAELPALIVVDERGDWQVNQDSTIRCDITQRAHAGTTWWGARFQDELGTIEYRMLPGMLPWQFAEVR